MSRSIAGRATRPCSSRCRCSALVVLALALPAVAFAGLEVGVASADITPPTGGSMYGYGARGDNVSTGVHDALHAKVLALRVGSAGSEAGERVAIVTLDLGAFEKGRVGAVRRLVRERIGVENVLLMASHSHSAPNYEAEFPTADHPYAREAEEKIAAAVVAAFGALRPARLAVGWTTVPEGHNRRLVREDGSVFMLWGNRERIPTSPVDYALGVAAFDTPAGEPIATLINFACHPVVLGPENLEISADYPGAMMARIEAETGAQAMFMQGAAGDINPFWDKTAPADGGFEQMRAMGERLAGAVLAVRRGLTDWRDVGTLAVVREERVLEPRWDLEAPEVEAAFRENEFGWIFERYRDRFARERAAEIAVVLLDRELAIGTFPGEFFVEHGLRFKDQSRIPDTFFAGYANGMLGYFPTIRAAAEGGYGGKEATIVEVGAGEALVSRALVLLHYLAGDTSRIPRFE